MTGQGMNVVFAENSSQVVESLTLSVELSWGLPLCGPSGSLEHKTVGDKIQSLHHSSVHVQSLGSTDDFPHMICFGLHSSANVTL